MEVHVLARTLQVSFVLETSANQDLGSHLPDLATYQQSLPAPNHFPSLNALLRIFVLRNSYGDMLQVVELRSREEGE